MCLSTPRLGSFQVVVVSSQTDLRSWTNADEELLQLSMYIYLDGAVRTSLLLLLSSHRKAFSGLIHLDSTHLLNSRYSYSAR